MKHMSLRATIYLGFAILGLLLLLMAANSYFGQSRLRAGSTRLEEIDRVSGEVMRLDRDVQELRLRIDRYIASGQDSYRQEVQRIRARISEQIQTILSEVDDDGIADLIRQIAFHLDESYEKFMLITEERALREDLVNNQLPKQATLVQTLLAELIAEVGDSDQQLRFDVVRVRESFSNSEKFLLRYFDDPDTGTANKATGQIRSATEAVASLEEFGDRKENLRAAIAGFERIGLRAVQATRSYLFFRNVVMAGEASEVAYYAKALRILTEERHDQIAVDVSATSASVSRRTTFIASFALVLSMLIAARLVVLVVPPIAGLADTFERLSAGENIGEIPTTNRQDEIGHMSRAAEVFSRKNVETARLLAESEELRAEIEQKAEELEAINEELDQFAYVASHDLKSPLRGVRQLTGWIEADAADQLSDESRRHLSLVSDRVTKMEKLLTDLLDYSRAGRVAHESELVDVSELVRLSVELVDNPSKVSVTWAEDLPVLKTVRAPLEQVLRNLIANAVKHNHLGSDGSVRIVSQRTPDGVHKLSVVDNGPGIDEANHARAFQMYQRVGLKDVPGTGMGLAIVKKQVEKNGGEITLDSSLGNGARFHFTWPEVVES